MKTQNDRVARDRRVGMEWLKRQATALSAKCPVDGSNPGHCPLFGLRALGVRERRAWLRGLSRADLEYLLCYHACCVAEKKRAAGSQ